MKSSILLFLVVFLSSFSSAFAEKTDLCICQIGDWPSNQRGFFKAGCKAWKMDQSCKKKVTANQGPITEVLEKYPDVKTLKIGYVGHWSSASESVQFLRDHVVPVIREKDLTVDVDNTACLATDNPYVIVNYLKTVDVADRITYRGNQAVSTGLWDKFWLGKNNFWAVISGKDLEVQFPSCKKFENKGCMGWAQGNESAVCHDEENDTYAFLRCSNEKTVVTEDEQTEVKKKKLSKWRRLSLDFKLNGNDYYSYVEEKNLYKYISFKSKADAEAFVTEAPKDARILLRREAERSY